MNKNQPKRSFYDEWDWYSDSSFIGSGPAFVSNYVEEDPVSRLYDAVEEATGKDYRPAKKTIGFY